MYVRIDGRFFYLIIFIDEYSRYIVHHSLLTTMDPDLESLDGSSFIAVEFKSVLRQNNLTQKLIRPRTPQQNGIVERANKTMGESMLPLVLTDYEQAKSEIFRIIEQYNNKRRHSSLNFLTPKDYHRGNPEELLRIRESKIERARVLRRETNMKERNGGERAGTVS